MTKGHKVEIRNTPEFDGAQAAAGIEILLDGVQVKSCTKAVLVLDSKDVVRLHLELFPQELAINVENAFLKVERMEQAVSLDMSKYGGSAG